MQVFIQLTYIGANAGPTFSLFEDTPDSFATAFATGVLKSTLLAGATYTVDNDATTIRIRSEGGLCDDVDFSIVVCTTTTSTTLEPTTTTTSTTVEPVTTTTTSTTSPPPPLIEFYQVRTTSTLGDICLVAPITVYSIDTETWTEGTTLYMDSGLTTIVPYDYIVLVDDGIVRNISGGVLGTATGDNCGTT